MGEKPAQGNVQLGCGTLIIIALIVLLFSGGREAGQLRSQLDDVDRKIDRLEKKVDSLAEKLVGPSFTPERPAAGR